ncbi:MAG TPA: hypothetical protein VFL53_12195 [Pseudolabrys sp.]|jgi:hypothetical protein|nr:hypothetical protein [Pseudolabrys sp.]
MKRFSLALLGAVGAFFVLTPAQAADYRVIQWNDTKICQVVDMAGFFKPISSNYTVLTKKSLPTFAAAMKARADVGAKAKCIL